MAETDEPGRDPTDILVNLCDPPALDLTRTDAARVVIRRPIAPEKHAVTD